MVGDVFAEGAFVDGGFAEGNFGGGCFGGGGFAGGVRASSGGSSSLGVRGPLGGRSSSSAECGGDRGGGGVLGGVLSGVRGRGVSGAEGGEGGRGGDAGRLGSMTLMTPSPLLLLLGSSCSLGWVASRSLRCLPANPTTSRSCSGAVSDLSRWTGGGGVYLSCESAVGERNRDAAACC